MSILKRSLKVAINPKLINRNESNESRLYSNGWINVELTPTELAAEIDKGIAYCAQVSGKRCSDNFLCSDVLSVDMDGTCTIDEAMANPIVQKYLTIFYTTTRHTEKEHRFRLIFALPRTIYSAKEMRSATRSLSLRLSGDSAATDPARMFFGSRGSKPQVFDRCIDESFLAELIKQGQDTEQPDTKGSKCHASTISRLTIQPDTIIITGKGSSLKFTDLTVGTSVRCPFHHDRHASAFITRSRTGTHGLHCSTCRQTFWPEGSSLTAHDFFDFDQVVIGARRYFDKHRDSSDRLNVHLGCNITLTNDRYLRLEEIGNGLTLIKSPKNSGKTQLLEALVAKDAGSILLIGHRVTLLRNTCRRLGLDLYLDQPEGPLSSKRLGVCLDSLGRLASPDLRTFSTIIIDESEQVLSHFLSETMAKRGRGPEHVFIIFKELLRRAKRVIALDADLSWTTFDPLTKMRSEPKRSGYTSTSSSRAKRLRSFPPTASWSRT